MMCGLWTLCRQRDLLHLLAPVIRIHIKDTLKDIARHERLAAAAAVVVDSCRNLQDITTMGKGFSHRNTIKCQCSLLPLRWVVLVWALTPPLAAFWTPCPASWTHVRPGCRTSLVWMQCSVGPQTLRPSTIKGVGRDKLPDPQRTAMAADTTRRGHLGCLIWLMMWIL